MDARKIMKEQELRAVYYDPSSGYQSAEKLYRKLKENGVSISRKDVREWLEYQNTYTRFKRKIRPRKYLKTFVKNLADQLQLDLVDMQKYGRKNKGNNWILTGVEILSRYAFAVPVYRKNTESMTSAVDILLKRFKGRFGKYPTVIQFDEGKEFYNVGVKTLLKEHEVEYFSSRSEKKAAIVERFNRTLKTMMWKYFYAENTENWLGVLDELVGNYNNTVHRTIHMKPKDVTEKNENEVWVTLYGSSYGGLPKFRVGDTVRVIEYKNVFAKGYKANFLEEIYEVTRVVRGDPNVYELKDPEDGEPIFGKFYEEELSAVSKRKGGEYKVEKILKKQNGMALVKWQGYDDKEAGSRSWVPLKDIPGPPVSKKE